MYRLSAVSQIILLGCFVFCSVLGEAADQEGLYFPKAHEWATVSPLSVGIKQAKLNAAVDFAMDRKSSGVIVLHRGRILAERYGRVVDSSFRYKGMVHGTTASGQTIEDVASVQKSVASVLLGIAVEKQMLRLSDSVSQYLGDGWSKANRQQEVVITIRHLITMTTGLDDSLNFVMPAGSKWKYNSTAYGKTVDVVTAAAKMPLAELTSKWLTDPLGMTDSKWITRRQAQRKSDVTNPHGFITSARDLARFGLMMLANGHWNGKTIVGNFRYLNRATSSSQSLNPAYGYLWWLNGQQFTLRGTRKVPGPLIPGAPKDLYAALGALGRKCYVAPKAQLVVVRLGDDPNVNGGKKFDEELWRHLRLAVQ